MRPAAYRLLGHTAPTAVVAWRDGRAITAAEFLAHVRAVAGTLPEGGHVLNACADRYLFAVGLYASLLRGTVSMLPPTQTPEMIRSLRAFAPDLYCLSDQETPPADLALFQVVDRLESAADTEDFDIPELPANRLVACVFTSGSTGVPQPHRKHWGSLVVNVRNEARRLGIAPGHTILGTVPAQHMYGFESTVLIALLNGAALCAQKPFYPADIAGALAALPRPRALVTTPFHLRTLFDAELPIPAADLVVSATAPLSVELAQAAEAAFGAPLLEIYGATETGQLATRRTADTDLWTTFDGVTLRYADEQLIAQGGHIEGETPLGDLLELLAPDQFRLLGRAADVINIAGKRTSLGYLNHQLTSLPGVRDGIFFMPDDEAVDGVTRLMAFAVAPDMTARSLAEALRERIDPVFLPRPLVLVDALPRNSTGKLPRDALRALARQHRG